MRKRACAHPLHRTQQGFTLIEAIVAMVLVATTGMALFSWINSNLITLNRVQEANAESAATSNVVDYLSTVNPMITPEGEAKLGDYQVRWKATISDEPRDGAGYPYGTSLYQLALYQTQVQVQKPDGQAWFDFTLQQVGYKQVRILSTPF
jgi:general secretion pathway protein I